MDEKAKILRTAKGMCPGLIITTHLYKDFTPLLNDIGLMFQVVFGGLTDMYLHALLRQTHIQKTTAKVRSIEIQAPSVLRPFYIIEGK